MDYTEILTHAESKLDENNKFVIDEIKLRIRSGSTGGEIGSLVGGYLKPLRDQNAPAYLILKNEIDQFLRPFKFIKN